MHVLDALRPKAEGGRKRNAAEKIAQNIARKSNYPQPQVVKPHLMTVKHSMQACCGLVEHCISTCSMTTGKYSEPRRTMKLRTYTWCHLRIARLPWSPVWTRGVQILDDSTNRDKESTAVASPHCEIFDEDSLLFYSIFSCSSRARDGNL